MKTKPIILETTIKKLEEKCLDLITNKYVQGLAVALVSKNDILYMKGYGYTSKNKTKAVDENTRFAYQSTGKAIVAAITMKAVQEGLVNLDNPITTYYPEFFVQSTFEDNPSEKITLRHLLSHSSGLQEGTPPGVGFDEHDNIADPSYEERIASLQGSWLRYPVGSAAAYSNFGIDLVTYVLQRASRKLYPIFAKESFFDQLEMYSVIYDRETALQDSDTARGYLGGHEAVIRDSVAYGAGMPFLSIKDLATFAQFLLNKGSLKDKTIVKEEFLNEMFKGDYSRDYFGGYGSRYANYGLGMFLNSINGEIKLWHHPGGAFGYNSDLVCVPELDCGIVIMTNNEYNAPIEEITIEALRNMLEENGIEIKSEEIKDTREEEAIVDHDESLKRLEGWYSFVGYDNFLVEYKNKKLLLNNQELTLHKGEEFSTPKIKRLVFEVDEKGNPQYLIYWHEQHGKFRAKFIRKVQKEPKLRQENIQKHVGLYSYYYYGIERWYFALQEKDGYLYRINDNDIVLYPSNIKRELFFDYTGKSYEFFNDYVLVGHVKMLKCKNPVEDLKKLSKSAYKARYINDYNLNYIEKLLRKMNQQEEADKVKALRD